MITAAHPSENEVTIVDRVFDDERGLLRPFLEQLPLPKQATWPASDTNRN